MKNTPSSTADASWGPLPALSAADLPDARTKALRAVAEGAATVASVADQVDSHPNMARRHLEALVADGLLVASLAASAGRGRPARVYELTDRGRSLLAGSTDELSVEYVSLTSAFATHIAATSSTPERDARSIGRAWGASLTAKVPERTVVQLLGRLGFSPEPRDERVVALRTCPLLEAARAHPEVVCQVHLGLVQGASAQYGGTGRGGRLEAFAERGACVLQLPR